MVHIALKASRFLYQHSEALDFPIAISGCVTCVFHSGISSMKEINSKMVSNLCTLAPNGEPCITDSFSASEDPDTSSMSVKSTPEIEKKFVHHVYDAIAPHFSSTRFAKWPKVATFLSSLPSGSLVLDAGCGNGKYLGLNHDCFFTGCDISPSLIKICSDRGHEVLVADAVNLPYRTGFGDAAISIAVLHHLSTENRRRKAIEELVRVVKKGGLVLITVWAVEQEDGSLITKWTPLKEKYVEEWIGPGGPFTRAPSSLSLESISESEESSSGEHMKVCNDSKLSRDLKEEKNMKNQQEYFVPWHLPYHRAEVSGASAHALATGLATKDDKKGAVVYNRYYHVFSEGELESLATGINNARVVDQFFDKSNWCMILEKMS
ncbi:tRNA (carboxymethyluridine(34)-5-O)-methyltransferase-like [Gastrolobium bilobum]|uniref:tRNA (carboxymethyluridine(34)-5-O)-methyltransferase-like n=1 Tax=Gastrolobium bilobum TaxID=150636 RepID=UPI002AB2CF9B|nr:tRNA (carboxymethyluridine(34)-5-O)-methyltransferase-like [Gastrolobium bilobum]XP_061365343.1 tRNA (carboxymethyluridine(34)-5-O)-methyltransferase-like [Gastrolobium bilobum]